MATWNENLTEEQNASLERYAGAITNRNSEHGGRVSVSLSNPTFGVPPEDFLDIPEMPEGLSGEEQARWNETVDSLLNMTFDSGYQNLVDNYDALSTAVDYTQDALDQIEKDFGVIGSDSAQPGAVSAAERSIKRLSVQNTGDIKNPDSALANYRAKGPAYLSSGAYAYDIPADEIEGNLREAAEDVQNIPTQLNPQDYYRTPGAEQLVERARQDRANINYNPIAQAQSSYAPAPTQWDAAQTALSQAPAAAQYQAAQSSIAQAPAAAQWQAAQAALSQAPAAAQWQAAQAGAAAQWQAQQVAATELARVAALQDPSGQYAQLQARELGQDEFIDSAPVDMVFSEWEDPAYLEGISEKGTDALEQGIDYFQELVANDGRDAVSEAYFHAKQQEAEQLRRSTLDASLRDLDERGMGGGGGELQANIQGANQSMKSQFDAAMQATAIAQQRKDAASQQQAMMGEALRKMQFGEAATIDDALRQVRMARGALEFDTQANNTGKLYDSRESDQRFREGTTMQRNDFLNNASLQDQRLGTDVNMFNAGEMNTTNRFNVGEANRVGIFNTGEANDRSEFNVGEMNRVGMFNTDQTNLTNRFNVGEANEMSRFNTGETNRVGMFNTDQTNLTNRFNVGETNRVNMFNTGETNRVGIFNTGEANDRTEFNTGEANRVNMFNTGETNRVGIFNTGEANDRSEFNVGEANATSRFNAGQVNNEYGARNRFQETGIINDYDMLGQALFADKSAQQQIDEGNFGRALSSHNAYIGGLQVNEGLRIDAANEVSNRPDKMEPWEEALYWGGNILSGGANVVAAGRTQRK